MKIFAAFLKTEKRSAGLYRVDFLLKVLYSLVAMYGIRSLWAALYAQDPAMVGRSLPSMITYAMLAIVLDIIFYPSALSTAPQNYIAWQVRTGRIDTDLLRPVDLQWQLLARNGGAALFGLLWLVLPVWLLGVLFLGMELPPSFLHGVAFLVSTVFSFLILFSLNFMLGMVCFATTNIKQITMAYSGVLRLLSGSLIPKWLYPQWMQTLINLLPFRCIFETPLNIYTGAVSNDEVVYSMLLQILWVAALLPMGKMIWLGVHRRLTVQGG
ncbi:ABC transporter permease [Parablautia intestinalis]|uniref:ABC transporter permease n=1 Tax=Parablautia intestinalis TaxID=2320100 RepID=UPI00256F0706|nr:ABC-2 family transporter protein [Parablautia intestinalis]